MPCYACCDRSELLLKAETGSTALCAVCCALPHSHGLCAEDAQCLRKTPPTAGCREQGPQIGEPAPRSGWQGWVTAASENL